jgi:hypothetical protein
MLTMCADEQHMSLSAQVQIMADILETHGFSVVEMASHFDGVWTEISNRLKTSLELPEDWEQTEEGWRIMFTS